MTANRFSELSRSMADAVEKAGHGIVLVNARQRFPASGIVFREGLVLTADHVVEREDEISVKLPDGTDVTAAVAGRDSGSDLALLKLDSPVGTPLHPAAADARIGEFVLALGRPSTSGLQASLGVVSAVRGIVRVSRGKRRNPKWSMSNDPFIYTDAIPYPGFSGGPLINAEGEMLALNTSGLVRGTSLGIPAARALMIADALLEHGSVRRGYLGIRSQPTPLDEKQQSALNREQDAGLLIVWIEEDSPSAAGGMIVGDILVALNGLPVDDHHSLQHALSSDLVEKPIVVEVLRGGARDQLTITIGSR